MPKKNYNIYSKKFYKSKKTLKRGVAVAATSFVAVALVLSFACFGIYRYFFGAISKGTPINPTVPQTAHDVFGDKEVTNIALFGIDSRSKTEPSRSDAIMILTIDRAHKKIKMTSIARDTYVDIAGHGKDKITHAYIFGWTDNNGGISAGAELAINTINNAFNLNITDYITANFWALANIVNYVGGVDIDISAAELRDINANYIPYMQKIGIDCEEIEGTGMQHLTGGQAVAYCRVRHVDGDVQRGGRQREVLMAMYDDVKSLSVTKYPELIRMVLKECTSSLTDSEILSIVSWAASNKSELKFEMLGLPTDDLAENGKMMNGVWYYVYDLDRAAKKIESFILETDNGESISPEQA